MPESGGRGSLKKIKSGALSRGLSLARVSLSIGASAATQAAVGLLRRGEDEASRTARLDESIRSHVAVLARELGQLKGSLMKVGQALSMYGEHFLPPEANALLKSLQSQSPALEWAAVEKVLKRQLPAERLAELEIEPEPMAAASLGQVHRARRRSDGQAIALKIQYPGVDKAIESDISALRRLLTLSKLIPRGPSYDELFREVRAMLHREVDYRRELAATQEFAQAFTGDSRFVVPRVFPEYSTARVLATSLEEGVALDSPEVAALSQERRNALGVAALEAYLTELFQLGKVQTDPHLGNYRVRLAEADGKPDKLDDRLVLLDFGAVREIPEGFRRSYLRMVRGAFERDRPGLERAAQELGMLESGDPGELKQLFWDLCLLITEPFAEENVPYDFGRSDLPRRVARKGAQMVLGFRLRTPPRELVFLDRKLSGNFVLLSVLKCRFAGRQILARYFAALDRAG